MEIPFDTAASAAMTRQAITMSVIKQGAEMDKAMASILEQSARNVPVSASRGTNLNMLA